MATVPTQVKLSAKGPDILNAVRAACTAAYQEAVPEVIIDDGMYSLHMVGNSIMGNVALRNEFITTLINQIGMVMFTNRLYDNPWKRLKKGVMGLGETIQEIFVELCHAYNYNPTLAETTLFKRETPDVRTALHSVNLKALYPTTVMREQLRLAFTSYEGVTNLVTGLIGALERSANYDEFQVMKYMLALVIIGNSVGHTVIPALTAANVNGIVSTIKGVSNDFTFMNTDYNMAHVHNNCPKDNQILILNTAFDSLYNVESLAAAFNMDKRQFSGQQIMVDSFGKLDTARLAELFADDVNYTAPTEAELAIADSCKAFLIDENFMQFYDYLIEGDEAVNGKGLYTNHFLHKWSINSLSPFSDAHFFTTYTPPVGP